MTRTLVLLAVGALLGAAAAWLFATRNAVSVEPGGALPRLDALPTSFSPPVPLAGGAAAAREAGPEFYRRLAEADVAELATMIAQTAAEPPSTDRDIALAVLLKRHAELDILGAVRLAREARVRGAALGAVYGAWARAAPNQVLAALSTVENPSDAAEVALALIGALGNDARTVERVAAVLAEREAEAPGVAMAAPMGIAFAPPAPVAMAEARSALGILAASWAELDPRRALDVARKIGDERIRLAFEAAALRSLARVAPDDVFAEIAALGASSSQSPALAATLFELARADPERLLSAVSELPTELRRIAQATAMQQLAERDPLAALRHLDRLPAGMERQAFTQMIARGYGRRDAAAALAWARSIPGDRNLIGAVIGGVAEQDPDRALDLALELTSPMERMQAVQFAAIAAARSDAAAETIANRLLAVDDPSLGESLAFNVVSMWASRTPDSAMRWLLANGQNMPPNLFQNVGQQLAMNNPRDAIEYSTQIPSAAREQWMEGVAHGYAQSDPLGAVEWLRQFRGEPWYERAALSVAMSAAQRDGAAAARIFEELDGERIGVQAQQLTSIIASNWANHDPAAAAAWALDRRSEPDRVMAVRNVVAVWVNQDVGAARQWTLRLPQGELRDGALTTLVATTASRGNGGLDPGLLNAFASDQARAQAVLQVVQGLAYSDPTRARAIADAHVTDPAVRAQVEGIIEAARNNSRRMPGIGVANGVRLTPPTVNVQRLN